jgi:hypothetical protein
MAAGPQQVHNDPQTASKVRDLKRMPNVSSSSPERNTRMFVASRSTDTVMHPLQMQA